MNYNPIPGMNIAQADQAFYREAKPILPFLPHSNFSSALSRSLPPPASASVIDLDKMAQQFRITVLEMITHAQYGHTASALGMAEFFSAMYFSILRHNPYRPTWPGRDRLIVSNGHISAIIYTAMAHAGYFPLEHLKGYGQINSPLQGHPHRIDLPGIECTSGSLGQGVSIAIGMALAAKCKKQTHRIYLLSSDGEQQEGQVWEAYMSAVRHKLDNLTIFVDRNGIQNSAFTRDIMPEEDLAAKYRAYNMNTLVVDGHDTKAILAATEKAKECRDGPTIIILDTIPGKGVDFMENNFEWHGEVPSPEQLANALHQIKGA